MIEAKSHLLSGYARIAVLSDTHGLLRPEVLSAVEGVDHILHAGDVGDPAILQRLSTIAPVTAIRGNIDTAGPCSKLPPTEMVQIGEAWFYLLHNLTALDINPSAAGVHAVIYGHTHQPAQRTHNGVLYLNPGSVGPRRFRLPIAMAFVTIRNGLFEVEMKVFDT